VLLLLLLLFVLQMQSYLQPVLIIIVIVIVIVCWFVIDLALSKGLRLRRRWEKLGVSDKLSLPCVCPIAGASPATVVRWSGWWWLCEGG
jgi:hypothetical protein